MNEKILIGVILLSILVLIVGIILYSRKKDNYRVEQARNSPKVRQALLAQQKKNSYIINTNSRR